MKDLPSELQSLDNLNTYRLHLGDAAFWAPWAREVCRRHGFGPAQVVRSGLQGTYPTMIVDDRWVVKFLGRLFEGGLEFETEQEVNHFLATGCPLPIPAVLTTGQLFPGAEWPWPYLVFEYVPGVSVGEVYEQVSWEDRVALAWQLGEVTRRLHDLPVLPGKILQPSWDSYLNLLRRQREKCAGAQRAWGALPAHMLEQIDSFLLPPEELIEWDVPPHLIHGDITRDNVLGQMTEGRWRTNAIIDWGDALVGSELYELVALHLDVFRCDKRLLRVYLDAYGLPLSLRPGFAIKATCTALLHLCNVFVVVSEPFPQARELATLDELAVRLWDVEEPGLGE